MDKRLNTPHIRIIDMNHSSRNAFQRTLKVLGGLFALAIACGACRGCVKMMAVREQQQKLQDALDRKTRGVLINKQIFPTADHQNNALLYLDTDGNLATAEAMINMCYIDGERALTFYNMTNGTTKTMTEWKQMVGPHNISRIE